MSVLGCSFMPPLCCRSLVQIVWLTLLPFTLWSTAGFGTIPLSLTIAYLLLGV